MRLPPRGPRGRSQPTWTRCLLLAFRYTAISDERFERLQAGHPSRLPIHLEEFLENKEANAASTVIDEDHAHLHSVEKATWERNEAAALEEAALDLVRLDRYERLAWSQQKRAILEFMNIKLIKEMRGRKAETRFAAE
jgi:hypothetical protein